MKIKLTLAYSGTRYAGWQVQGGQENVLTIQGELERAVQVLLRSEWKKQIGEECNLRAIIIGSGRTDSGVHAQGQTASFVWPDSLALDLKRIRSALDGILPRDISVVAVDSVASEFDARRTFHIKRYRYLFHFGTFKNAYQNEYIWGIPERNLNWTEMIRTARMLRGRHDFSNFRAADCSAHSTVRTLQVSEIIRTSSDEAAYIVEGCGFLKQMVRIMARAIIDVGRGKRERHELEALLNHPEQKQSLPQAPAHGLVLDWVRYEQEH